MQDLSNDLFKKIVSSLVERCVKTKYEYFKMPTIHNSFNGLVSKYSKLNEFMNSFSLSLAIKDTDYRVKGDFRMMAKNTGAITLRISYDDIRNSLVKYVKPSLGKI
jgi:hypothetical protein